MLQCHSKKLIIHGTGTYIIYMLQIRYKELRTKNLFITKRQRNIARERVLLCLLSLPIKMCIKFEKIWRGIKYGALVLVMLTKFVSNSTIRRSNSTIRRSNSNSTIRRCSYSTNSIHMILNLNLLFLHLFSTIENWCK